MRIYETSTIDSLIALGKTVDITYYKTSIQQIVEHIECSAKNVFYDYSNYIKDNAVNVELSTDEYHKYLYRPKLLAFDVYGSTDLHFIIMLLNDINNEKDFNMKNVKLLRPTDIELLNRIYNTESKYIMIANQEDEFINTNYDDDYGSGISTYSMRTMNPSDDTITYLNEVRKEIQNIKTTIRTLVEEVINTEMTDLIRNQLDEKIEEIKNMLDEFADQKLSEKIQGLLDHIAAVKAQLEDKIDLEVDMIYEELYLIRQDIKNIIAGGGIEDSQTIKDIITRLNELEGTINSLNNLISTIVEQKITDRLTIITSRLDTLELLIPSTLKSDLDNLKSQVTNIMTDVEQLLSDNYTSLIQDINNKFGVFKQEVLDSVQTTIQQEIDALSAEIQSISNRTRDIVFKMNEPISLGAQTDTEFTIPYIGSLKQFVITIGRESIMTSNIIFKIQKYDDTLTIPTWLDIQDLTVFAGDYITKIDCNFLMDHPTLRIIIESGDMNTITGINMIMKFLEDIEEITEPETTV